MHTAQLNPVYQGRKAAASRQRSKRTARTAPQLNDEHAEQVALFKWAALNVNRMPALSLMFAIPNGGRRDPVTGARLKAEGVKAGVPDIFLPYPSPNWNGLFIELKKMDGKTSIKQKEWITKLTHVGYRAVVCVGWEAAAREIETYLEIWQ